MKYVRSEEPYLLKGRTAKIVTERGNVIGVIGEADPAYLERFGVRFPVGIAEIYLEEVERELRA